MYLCQIHYNQFILNETRNINYNKSCEHPKHDEYKNQSKNTKKKSSKLNLQKVPKRLIEVLGLNESSEICSMCRNKTDKDSEYLQNEKYKAPIPIKKNNNENLQDESIETIQDHEDKIKSHNKNNSSITTKESRKKDIDKTDREAADRSRETPQETHKVDNLGRIIIDPRDKEVLANQRTNRTITDLIKGGVEPAHIRKRSTIKEIVKKTINGIGTVFKIIKKNNKVESVDKSESGKVIFNNRNQAKGDNKKKGKNIKYNCI